MAAELKVFHAVDLTVDGETQPGFGSMVDPIKLTTLTGGSRRITPRRLVVPADDTVSPATDGVLTVWEWADTQGFDYLAIVVRGSGYLRIAYLVEPVTSSSDETPTGANGMWMHVSKSCVGAFELDADRCKHNTVAADVVGTTSSQPTLWTDSGTTDGVIAKIMVWNEDTDADVEIDLYVVGE